MSLNIRFIVKMLGMMCILETLFMLMAVAVAFLYEGDDFYPLLQSSGIMFGTGVLLYSLGFRANEYSRTPGGDADGHVGLDTTFTAGNAAFYLGGYIGNVTDAFFETMSGFTTTGSTILTDIESLPHGILFWRSLTQWQGGLGMIVFTVALIPIFGGGATQMFNEETPGITHERFRPRVSQVAKRLWGVYVLLTLLLMGLLMLGPMNLFDAVNHALTTIATGGYSTKNASIAYWDSAYVESVISLFMFIGATNITLIYFCLTGHARKLFSDEELRWFFGFVLLITTITTGWILWQGMYANLFTALRHALFNVVSIITTTGFMTDDYIGWGPFFWGISIVLMFICGCAGSTSGGLKMGRFAILSKTLFNEFKKQTHPQAVLPVRMDSHIISGEMVHRILAFTFAYIMLIMVGCTVLLLDGMGFEESVGAAISAISNVGPALGDLGPAGNYAEVPALSKWILSFLMMTGRLEIFTVLTILVPSFWKQ